ncbi:hypothetical protein ACXIUT_16700 [Achromobacter denitrificans]
MEASKIRTRALASRQAAGGGPADDRPLLVEGALAFHGAGASASADSAVQLLASLFGGMEAGGYAALLAYVSRDAAHESWLASMRRSLRQATGAATMGGFGPRYLHSSGQLHKGGPAGGRFLFVTADAPAELDAPGQASGFAATQRTQALGDMEELASRGRPCLRVHVSGPLEAGLAQLARALRQALAAR